MMALGFLGLRLGPCKGFAAVCERLRGFSRLLQEFWRLSAA